MTTPGTTPMLRQDWGASKSNEKIPGKIMIRTHKMSKKCW